MHPIAWLLAPSSAPSVACPRMPGPVGRPVAADPRGPESAYAASAIAGSRRGSAIRPAETDRCTEDRVSGPLSGPDRGDALADG